MATAEDQTAQTNTFKEAFNSVTGDYDTPLSTAQEEQFKAWQATLGERGGIDSYDLKGYWLDNIASKLNEDTSKPESSTGKLGENTGSAQQSVQVLPQGEVGAPAEQTPEEGAHFPDTYKKPNHTSFSDESVYHNPEAGAVGGKWEKDIDGTWHFHASQFNVDMHGEKGLTDHFRNNEPDSVLHLPERAKK